MKGTDEDAKKAARNSLYLCLDMGLRLLHPSMPYITEELFQRLPHGKENRPESICIAPYPNYLKSYDEEQVEDKMKILNSAVKAFRSQFTALNLPKNANPHVALRCKNNEMK